MSGSLSSTPETETAAWRHDAGAVLAAGGLFEVGPHIAANDPASVLRLCQAHRDILDIWKYSAYAKETFGTSATTERLLTMNEIVEALARGYGIEEDA